MRREVATWHAITKEGQISSDGETDGLTSPFIALLASGEVRGHDVCVIPLRFVLLSILAVRSPFDTLLRGLAFSWGGWEGSKTRTLRGLRTELTHDAPMPYFVQRRQGLASSH